MRKISPLVGKSLRLVEFIEENVSSDYISWLNDPKVIQYLQVRFADRGRESLLKAYEKSKQDPNQVLFSIVCKATTMPIGTCRLSVDSNHNTGNYGYMIGNKCYWGTGAGKESQVLLINFCFQKLKLRKLTTGIFSENVASKSNFLKLGFKVEVIRRQQFLDQFGNPTDGIIFGLSADDWAARVSRFKHFLIPSLVK